ncbi:hypothetical protein SAMN04488074_12961 [Lentzea albidocapillata subsp. violacea]|uniref:Uncharacterized protein n=1 Tax=Lentzea albidocapillata subsp. violacea TaxID=128104 RepID=A0A1G9X748_9PSEU|nr:hypothetical protein [Lentzea albidocapillata]SDM92558.1 hypothetical protein SAMN04488074_12961 [Lentzea albidocapillata subsp. violacea]
MRRNWGRTALCALSALVLVPTPVAQAEPVATATKESSSVTPAERDELLGKGWQASGDRLWTTTGDSDGLRLLVAEAKTGYAWRTAATLSQPGVETDRWIGNACVTGSGQRAVVVYAPRTFTNSEELATRGGFTAVVDLNSGAVTKLPIRTSLAYFNPGCGTAETVALTQEGDIDLGRTGVTVLDAASGKLGKRTELATQVTSATPVDGGFVVADAIGVLRVGSDGAKRRIVQETGGVPRELRADADGGVVYIDRDGANDRVQRIAAAATTAQKPSTLATAPSGQVALARGVRGKVFITGTPSKVESLPGAVSRLDVPAHAEVSTTGEAAVTDVKTALPSLFERKKASDPIRIESKSLRSGKKLGFVVDPAAALTPRWDETVDPNRVCSVPRNDPHLQVYQPKPKQVEWAANMAISGHLDISRPRNWNNNGLDAYRPQDTSMFPRVGLTGGGQVPAQVLLGVLGQESNLWQADRRKLPGEFGNPLIGNYYGTAIYNADPADDWIIRWDKADCGYGVTQMTDGMRLPGKPKPDKPNDEPMTFHRQRAIGTDYAANVAAGLRLLEIKWNEMQASGMRINNNNPARIENWFFAVWAYNSGLHPRGEAGANGAWGVGWLNNPANPRYPSIRQRFGKDPKDYAKPQQWPYPEKVLGFAANPPSGYEAPGVEVPFFRAAWWGGANPTANRDASVPPLNQFCTTSNDCRWGQQIKPTAPEVADEPAGPCAHTNAAGQTDLKCWVHESSSWRLDCDKDCGHEFIRYDWDVPEYRAEPANGTSYPPRCTNVGLEDDAGIADDVTTATKPVSNPSCPIKANMAGASFSLDFGGKNGNDASGRIDLHQTGGGYGAHFWYGHTRSDNAEGRALAINATWKFGRIDGLATVKAHIPDHLANAVVDYYVDTAAGPKKVTIDQGAGTGFNRWVTLGTFHFFNEPTVRLGTIREGADGTKKVAFDAVAIEPFRGLHLAGSRIPVQIAQNNNNFCMVLKDNNPNNGAVVEARPCSTWGRDYWTLFKVGETPPNGNEPTVAVQIMDNVTEKCLEPVSRGLPGSGVHETTCDKNNKAQWWLVHRFDRTEPLGFEVLMNYESSLSMRLSVPSNPPGSAAVPVTLWKRAPGEEPTAPTFYWSFL